MKNSIKLTVAAIVALLPLASSAFAGDQVGETALYRIRSFQVSNGQATMVVYEQKPATTIALNVRSKSVGTTSSVKNAKPVVRQDAHGLSQVTIPSGIN